MITWAVAEPSAGKMAAFAWEECPLAPITDMGALNGFYRNTQLQGHLVQDGLYLNSVPEFWTTGSDFPYRKKESDKEAGMGYAVLTTRGSNVYLHIWNSTGTELCFAAMKNRVLSARFSTVARRLHSSKKTTACCFGDCPCLFLTPSPQQSSCRSRASPSRSRRKPHSGFPENLPPD